MAFLTTLLAGIEQAYDFLITVSTHPDIVSNVESFNVLAVVISTFHKTVNSPHSLADTFVSYSFDLQVAFILLDRVVETAPHVFATKLDFFYSVYNQYRLLSFTPYTDFFATGAALTTLQHQEDMEL